MRRAGRRDRRSPSSSRAPCLRERSAIDVAFVSVVGPPTVKSEGGTTRVMIPVKFGAEAPEGALALDGHLDAGGRWRGDFRGSSKVFSTLLGFMLLAVGSAAFALLTPCVFPMIPVATFLFHEAIRRQARAVWDFFYLLRDRRVVHADRSHLHDGPPAVKARTVFARR
jgi:hypothetical protein